MVIARSSNLLGKITILVMVGLCVNTAAALDGSGTEQDPWRISSLADFNDFAADANYWDDYTRLETDVNLAGRVYETAVIAPDVNDGESGFQGTAFTGVFDGNDHKIVNLTIDDAGAGNDYLGLFGDINGGEVMDLGVEGGSVSGDLHVGGLAGYSSGGSILDCYSTGDVRGRLRVGGLVGYNWSTVLDCCCTGDVSGHTNVGGLVGESLEISNCYSTGDVNGVVGVGGLAGRNLYIVSNSYSTGDVSGNYDIGGLVGENTVGSISNCYSTGCVDGGGSEVGGLVGYNWLGNVSDCYSTGDVNGVDNIGGLVGANEDGSVSNCYSTGNVSGSIYASGLMGYNEGSISNCFWDTDTQTHGVTDSITYNYGTVTNVLGLPTSQLHRQSTFQDWDFINIWNIGENQTYPYLRVYLAGDINKDEIVNFLDVAITANQWMEGVE